VDERLRPASLVNRIVLPHEDAEDLNPAVNYTRFEAIFLAGLRKGGMPEE
jgi:hypothetical protein